MKISEILETLALGQDLSEKAAVTAFGLLMDGEMSAAQAGAFLMGLRQKGETPQEVAMAVKVCLEHARQVSGLSGKRIDVVGTGGDGKNSFNCSTATALILAGMGYQVTKHGNRAVSSSSGSADAIEGLGLPLNLRPEEVAVEVADKGFAFLFAPNFHPAFKHVMPVRMELGVRTMFNMLGPLLNPARPTHMLLGVAKPEIMPMMAEVLVRSGVERAAVLHGFGGYDELTPMGPAKVILVEHGNMRETEIVPAKFGIPACDPELLSVSGKKQGLDVLKYLLAGADVPVGSVGSVSSDVSVKSLTAMREMLICNVGVGVYLLEEERDLGDCFAMARKAVNDGVAKGVINA